MCVIGIHSLIKYWHLLSYQWINLDPQFINKPIIENNKILGYQHTLCHQMINIQYKESLYVFTPNLIINQQK